MRFLGLPAALIAAAVLAGCAGSMSESGDGVAPAPASASVIAPRATSAPSGTSAGSAAALLSRLPVKGRAPKTGYSRDRFGQAWADTDRNGCDTRNDVLRRDLDDDVIKPRTHGCVVLSGILADPYSGTTMSFRRGPSTSIEVQIDHVVALSDAWQTGAFAWISRKLLAFANDPLELLAVDGVLNEQKSDADAASWLPPNKAYRCAYVARQVAVKAKYGLWVTSPERDAMARILTGCPAQQAPSGPMPTVAPFDAPVRRG